MTARSWLFVPGDSERKQARAAASAADALILDLEDSVASGQLETARTTVAALLTSRTDRSAQRLWVRVNGTASGQLLADLAAVMPAAPDGIVVPKVASPDDLVETHHYLSALEQVHGLAAGKTQLLVIATETPQALLSLGHFAARGAAAPGTGQSIGIDPGAGRDAGWRRRLAALTWGAEDLAAALGAREKRAADGSLTPVFELARSLCLVAAAAAGVPAIDGVHADFRDREGLAQEVALARRDGFAGKLAIHPDQVDAINAAFTPTEAELAHARRVIAAFAASPHVGVTSLDGHMIDRPHLLQAERFLAAAAAAASHRRSGDG